MSSPVDKIRCSYTYLQQEIENAEVLLKLINDNKKHLWSGICSGAMSNEPMKNIDKRLDTLARCIDRIREHNQDIDSNFKQIVAEEQIRMQNFR